MPTEHCFQIFASHVELIHSKSNGFDGAWWTYGVVLGLMGFNERREYVQLIARFGPWLASISASIRSSARS